MARFRSPEHPQRWPDAFSASGSALESRGQSSSLPLAIVDGPVQGTMVVLPSIRPYWQIVIPAVTVHWPQPEQAVLPQAAAAAAAAAAVA